MALSAIQSAEHHFATVVKSAQKRSESRAEWDLPLTPMYVTGTLALNLLAHLVGAHEFSLALELPEPCLLAGNIVAQTVASSVPSLTPSACKQDRVVLKNTGLVGCS